MVGQLLKVNFYSQGEIKLVNGSKTSNNLAFFVYFFGYPGNTQVKVGLCDRYWILTMKILYHCCRIFVLHSYRYKRNPSFSQLRPGTQQSLIYQYNTFLLSQIKHLACFPRSLKPSLNSVSIQFVVVAAFPYFCKITFYLCNTVCMRSELI